MEVISKPKVLRNVKIIGKTKLSSNADVSSKAEAISKAELLSVLKRYHNMATAPLANSIKNCLQGINNIDDKIQFIDGNGNVAGEVEVKDGGFNDDNVATIAEVTEMLDDIFAMSGEGVVGVRVATNEEVQEMLDDVFKN